MKKLLSLVVGLLFAASAAGQITGPQVPTPSTDDTVLLSNGSIWQAKGVPNCTDTAGNHLNYATSTNAFSCGTSGTAFTSRTRQVFLSGTAATYTTPALVRQILVQAKGGGGGGAGGNTAADAGGTGGTTIFNSINANGGSGGNGASAISGAGGTGGTGTASVRRAGSPGSVAGSIFASATTVYVMGGAGGGQGAGRAGGGVGAAAVANSGGGGAGGAINTDVFVNVAAYNQPHGGGEGEYIEILINSPAGTYTYTIGAAGTAGAGGGALGNAGGAGGTGYIVVDEFYLYNSGEYRQKWRIVEASNDDQFLLTANLR